MKKAVGHLIPFMEKEKEQSVLEMKAAGTWNENVYLIIDLNCLKIEIFMYKLESICRSSCNGYCKRRCS